MACLSLISSNENFSRIIKKNPNTGMKIKSMKKGNAFGYFSEDDSAYNVVFFDSYDELSFKEKAEQEFEYIDNSKYDSPLFALNVMRDFFDSALNHKDDLDTKCSNAIYINSIKIRRINLFEKMMKYFDCEGFHVTFTELEHEVDESRKYRDFSLVITSDKTIYELLNFIYVISICIIVQNHIDYFYNHEMIQKTVKALNIIDAPYFIRYLVKTFIVLEKEVFELVKDELNKSTKYKINFSPKNNQNTRIIETTKAVDFNLNIVDIGCGEGSYLSIANQLKNNMYYAIDKDKKCIDYVNKKIRVKNIDNVITFDSITDFIESTCDDINDYTALMIEVIEHNSLKHSTEIIKKMLKQEHCKKIILSTPNKDFNKFYMLKDDESRHEDHKFEFTKQECIDFFNDIIEQNNKVNDRKFKFKIYNIGDEVNDISTSVMIILEEDVQ